MANLENRGRQLIGFGLLLFLLGLLTGLAAGTMPNPRMGLSSHLEGLLNGLFLMVLGLALPKLALSDRLSGVLVGAAVFGTYVNWATTLFSAVTGAGAGMMPIAGAGHAGSAWQETVVVAGLAALSLAMIAVCVMALSAFVRKSV